VCGIRETEKDEDQYIAYVCTKMRKWERKIYRESKRYCVSGTRRTEREEER
jgi:hypothetical protein